MTIMHSIEELKKLRKESGLTQAEVAKLTNFSQSLISQIESGEVDPRLSTYNKIYDVITQHRNKRQHRAIEIMKRDLISIRPRDTIVEAVKLMKKNGIEIVTVPQENLDQFYIAGEKARRNLIGKLYDQQLLERVENMLAEFRESID